MRIPTYRGSQGVAINMTPMIDVTFLLIIFFLVSSHLAKQENFLKLDLPVAEAGMNEFSDQPTLTIQVLPSGEYQINGQSMVLAQVRRAMVARADAEPNPLRIRIRTDRNADYEHVAAILKLCATTNNTDVVFAVYDEKSR